MLAGSGIISQKQFAIFSKSTLNYGHFLGHILLSSEQKVCWSILDTLSIEFSWSFMSEMLFLLSQSVFTCLKSTMETLENVWNLFKVSNKDTRIASITSFCFHHYQLWTDLIYSSSVSINDIEQIIASWNAIHWIQNEQ